MDNVHKPHNLSAISRSCDAVGIGEVHGVSGSDGFALWHRGAGGSSRWIERHAHATIQAGCDALRARGMTLAVADVGDDATDYRDVDYTRPFALIVGAELEGVTDDAREQADFRLTIPMQGMVESLNVSVAVALVLFQAATQRERAGLYRGPRLDAETYRARLFEWTHPKIARHCRQFGLDYPALDDDGEIVGDFPRGARDLDAAPSVAAPTPPSHTQSG